jgi:ribosomal protein S18 acetylase RimI-like enzyme
MEVTIRFGTSSDRPYVLDLGRRTIESSKSAVRPAGASGLDDLENGYERLAAFVFGRSHALLIAESALEKIGFLVLLDDIPDEVDNASQAFIAYMAVESHVRRQGVGKRLLDEAERIARERNLPALALMVTEGNGPARELYAQAGFATERRLLVKVLSWTDTRT